MTKEQSPEEPPLYFDPEKELFDPTGLFHEAPEDPYAEDWLKTAYFVRKALEENPNDPYLEASQSVIFHAITRREQELRQNRQRERRRPQQF